MFWRISVYQNCLRTFTWTAPGVSQNMYTQPAVYTCSGWYLLWLLSLILLVLSEIVLTLHNCRTEPDYCQLFISLVIPLFSAGWYWPCSLLMGYFMALAIGGRRPQSMTAIPLRIHRIQVIVGQGRVAALMIINIVTAGSSSLNRFYEERFPDVGGILGSPSQAFF